MATTTTNMSLRQWDVSTDLFSYTELKDNFGKLDVHDHTSGKGVQIPTGGIANGAVTLAKLATASVDSTKVADGSIADADLASPTNAVWRPLARFTSSLAAGTSGQLYASRNSGWTGVLGDTVDVFSWSASGMAVAGKTARWRTRTYVLTNGTAIGVTITAGVAPVTAASGAANTLALVTGAMIATSAVASPAANSIVGTDGALATAPGVGTYALELSLSGAIPANARVLVSTALEYSHT